MGDRLSTRSGTWNRATLTGAIIVTGAAPMPFGDTSALDFALQAPTSAAVPPVVIRPRTRTAANRTWFQLGTLVGTSVASGTAVTTLQVVGANGVTLRELIGFDFWRSGSA